MKNKNKNWRYYLPIASIFFIISACGSTADDSKSCIITSSTQNASSPLSKNTQDSTASLIKLQTKQAINSYNQFTAHGGVPIQTYTKSASGDYTLGIANDQLSFKFLDPNSTQRTGTLLELTSMLFSGIVIAVPDKAVIADPSDFAAVKKISLSSARFSFASKAGQISVKPETLLLPQGNDYRLYFYFPDIVTVTQSYITSSSTLRLDEYIENTRLNLEQAIANGYDYGFYAVTGKNALDCNPSAGSGISLVKNSKAFASQVQGGDLSYKIDSYRTTKIDFRGNKPEIDTWLVPNTFSGSPSTVTITSPISNIEDPEKDMIYAYSLDSNGLVSNLYYATLPRQYPEMLKYGSDRKLLPIQNLTWDNDATDDKAGKTWSYFSYLRPKVATVVGASKPASYCNNYSNLWQVGLNRAQVRDLSKFDQINGRYFYNDAEINNLDGVKSVLDISDADLRIKLPSASEYFDISLLSTINKELYLKPIAESLPPTSTINKLNFGVLSTNNSGLYFANAVALTLRETDPCYSKVGSAQLPSNLLSTFQFSGINGKSTITDDDTIDQRIDIGEFLSLKQMTLIEDLYKRGAVYITLSNVNDKIDTDLVSVIPSTTQGATCERKAFGTGTSGGIVDKVISISFTPDIGKDVATPACRIIVSDDKGSQKSYSFYFGLPIKVASRDDLASINRLQSIFSGIKEFMQTADISLDIADSDFTSGRTFYGSYDGNNKVINIDATSATRTGSASIFGTTAEVFEIKSLTIDIRQLPVITSAAAEPYGFLFRSIVNGGTIDSVNMKVSAVADQNNPDQPAFIIRNNSTEPLGFYAGKVLISSGRKLTVNASNLDLNNKAGLKSNQAASIGGYFGLVSCVSGADPSLVMTNLRLTANLNQSGSSTNTDLGGIFTVASTGSSSTSYGAGGFIGNLSRECNATLDNLDFKGSIGLYGARSAGGIVGIIERGTGSTGSTGSTTISDSDFISSDQPQSVIASASSATIKEGNAGGLVGEATSLNITNSHVSGVYITNHAETNGSTNSILNSGGLVGVGNRLMIGNSSSQNNKIAAGAPVTTGGGNAGGLVGSGDSVTISNSFATHTSPENYIQGTNFGGLVGMSSDLSAENSFFMGNLNIAENSQLALGGICGSCTNVLTLDKVLVSAYFLVSITTTQIIENSSIGGAVGNAALNSNSPADANLKEVAVFNNYDGLIATRKTLKVKDLIGVASFVPLSTIGLNTIYYYSVDLSTTSPSDGTKFIRGAIGASSVSIITGELDLKDTFLKKSAKGDWSEAMPLSTLNKEVLYLKSSNQVNAGFGSAQTKYYQSRRLVN